MKYIGRFAPSPSGPLHRGSLVAALGSFLRAKSSQGQWLVRIEDLDRPREMQGASSSILHSLEHHGLHWDGEIVYQSQRAHLYSQYLEKIQKNQQSYFCDCTRSKIKAASGFYQGHCRHLNLSMAMNQSIRFRATEQVELFEDKLLGQLRLSAENYEQDFILKRKDGYFSYPLAVVVDDYEQNITEVVRGADLIEATFAQINLQKALRINTPSYVHLPLVCDNDGAKLSKQNHAKPIENKMAPANLYRALTFLGQKPPSTLQQEEAETIIQWAVAHWQLNLVPKSM
ncbi:MAG: tRNA glutamyl-Q(34) synthetase GluQRS [Gammaproteobacteria bacterium CG22_combo_CG10-13_8_21_14_all_40_8]|nr:MAG: tRNA glutamyl-Q(34) synthetase GluQRS [Gammaproteobacteria bacterium CG22_combo_CG10-13_8_21_14_all_40_8]